MSSSSRSYERLRRDERRLNGRTSSPKRSSRDRSERRRLNYERNERKSDRDESSKRTERKSRHTPPPVSGMRSDYILDVTQSSNRKRKSDQRQSRDRSQSRGSTSSSKRLRTKSEKHDRGLRRSKSSDNRDKIKKSNGSELPNIKLIVKNNQEAASHSPVAEIQTDEEHHTDNDSDENTAKPQTRLSFESLAAQASEPGKPSFLSQYNPPARSAEFFFTRDIIEDTSTELATIDGDEFGTEDSLSELSDSDMDIDPTHRMALEYYNKYSKGELDWCQDFPELGPECRHCRMKGNCSFPCENPAKYQCKLCGLWSHRETFCPDKIEFEYKNNFNIPCVYCSKKNHLGRNCPDHWRQFHRTTSSTVIEYDNTPADQTKASCYNCAGNHWGHECKQRRIDGHGPVLDPFTTRRVLESQSDLLKESKIMREKQRKKRNRGQTEEIRLGCISDLVN